MTKWVDDLKKELQSDKITYQVGYEPPPTRRHEHDRPPTTTE